jgi:hypothetical protein
MCFANQSPAGFTTIVTPSGALMSQSQLLALT